MGSEMCIRDRRQTDSDRERQRDRVGGREKETGTDEVAVRQGDYKLLALHGLRDPKSEAWSVLMSTESKAWSVSMSTESKAWSVSMSLESKAWSVSMALESKAWSVSMALESTAWTECVNGFRKHGLDGVCQCL